MSANSPPPPGPPTPGEEPEDPDLDGHPLEELSDYLDSGRTPRRASIEDSPGCQRALQSMEHLRTLGRALLEEEARTSPAPPPRWFETIAHSIARDPRTAAQDSPAPPTQSPVPPEHQ